MRFLIIVASLLAHPLGMTAWAATPPELEPLAFLLGEWLPAGTGQPGEASGRAQFARGLQDRVILRTSYADYPATAEGPGSHHEDLMVIYAVGSGAIRADYYDNEGHLIRYTVHVPEPGRAVFVSESATGEPGFRLSYQLEATGVLKGAFDIAPPGSPEGFKPYLAWESRKATKPGK